MKMYTHSGAWSWTAIQSKTIDDLPVGVHYTVVEEPIEGMSTSYAYEGKEGDVVIKASTSENPLSIKISFIDQGTPYNPLAKPDPNTSLALMERQKGGLGIFMVKKTMDDMTYEYKNGKNILTIIKNI